VLRTFVLRAGSIGMIGPATREAWNDLDAKVRPFVARRVRSPVDVDDVVQEVFLRMHRGLGALREDERFGPWVYRIARSAIADHRRVAVRHRVRDAEPTLESTAPAPGMEDDDEVEQLLATCIAPLIAMLRSPYREALMLTELEGLTQKAAAEMLGISLSGMKSRVQRGRQELRAAIEACCVVALDPRGRVVACEPRSSGPLPGCRCR